MLLQLLDDPKVNPVLNLVSIPQAVSAVATRDLKIVNIEGNMAFQYRKR